ncbi:MAG: 4Fe-4S dicluster domain-containing protein [Bacteroidota bacterium]
MVDFGYKIQADSQINLDKTDKTLARFVRQRENSFTICIGCGTCTATCSAAKFTDFNFRKLQLFVKRGEMAGIKTEIAKCMLCGKCQLACPRGVNTRNVIMLIKKGLEEHK